ncbi:MAG: hypothetical protein GY854_20515 [Deltaproteobacteria bacterium]|nr:hypothetical protein [Deltaproteobacteria bacterium]
MKMRKLEERLAMVAKFRSSGLEQGEFAEAQGVNVRTLQNWLTEARRLEQNTDKGCGFVEVEDGSSSHNAIGQAACKVVAGVLAFEFGVLPEPNWLAEFAHSFSNNARK